MPNHTNQTNTLQFRGRVVAVRLAEVARISVRFGDKEVETAVPLEEAERMQIGEGDEVIVTIRPAGVTIAKGGSESA